MRGPSVHRPAGGALSSRGRSVYPLLAAAIGIASLGLAQLVYAQVDDPEGDQPGCPSGAPIAAQLNRDDVRRTSIVGGCHDLTVFTTLDDGALEAIGSALDICDSASALMYGDDSGAINSVTVLANAHRELAISIKGQPCIGEP